jgi:hypothetical protein
VKAVIASLSGALRGASKRLADLLRLPAVVRLRPLARHLPIALTIALLSYRAIGAVLAQSGGQAALPLDDAYIHFQYARSFAELHPFQYTRGAVPAPGTTSLIWPLILAPFYAVGIRGTGPRLGVARVALPRHLACRGARRQP